MKLCIQVEVDDNAKRDEIDYALREAGRLANLDVYMLGCLEVDEERELQHEVNCVQTMSIFRPE